MDSTIELSLKKADNEIILAKIIQRISNEGNLKKDIFQISESFTFYSSVIEHSYYAIFNNAKAYLMSKGIVFSEKQGQHQKVYYEFRKHVRKGIIDSELLKMYDIVIGRADELLKILEDKRDKRGKVTYEKLPETNKSPAEDSLTNAQKFYQHIYTFINNSVD